MTRSDVGERGSNGLVAGVSRSGLAQVLLRLGDATLLKAHEPHPLPGADVGWDESEDHVPFIERALQLPAVHGDSGE
jgi:hypothetical protein